MATKHNIPGRPPTPISERFWLKVRKGDVDSCWVWTGGTNADGYGRIRAEGCHALQQAHRVSWELHNGQPVPDSLMVLHRCDNPPCVNPAHLFLGTNTDNMRDMAKKGRNKSANNTRLTEGQVRAIRQRHASGEQRRHLALEYGVTRWHISGIVCRRSWPHLQ